MTTTGWRLVRRDRADSAFTGEAARRFGGRWSPPGVPVIYLSDSPALAAVELLVHLPLGLTADYVFFRVEWPHRCMAALVTPTAGWQASPPDLASQQLGRGWAEAKRTAVLRVPSALVPGHANYLLNPRHPDFARITIHAPEPFTLRPQSPSSDLPSSIFHSDATR